MYNSFAYVYDRLMSDIDYDALCENTLSLCKKYGHTPSLVLDAACGTGSFTKCLADRGFDVTGVDLSEEMLSVASERVDSSVLLLCQDLCELDLYGTVDTAFCMLDGFNHILNKRELKKAISKISLFTEPGGLLIFDVNTIYKHRRVLADNTFACDYDDIYLVWQNECHSNTVDIYLDFFCKNDNGYNRMSDSFSERAYSVSDISEVLMDAGYEILEICDFDTMGEPHKYSEKLIFTTRKVR
ncbi:MAG: class I SAM-dependent methyltransferase [Clostridia bacterium]|nr:class I SAM-dependent methyltransferase [Clostridia bacterium]